MTAFIVWTVGGLLRPPLGVLSRQLIAGLAFILWMREYDYVHFRLPENARQIPQSVFAYGQGRAYLQFGFELGTGVRTHVTSSVVYLVPVVVLLIPKHFVGAVVLALAYAIGRSLVPLVSGVGGAGTRSAILTVVVSNSIKFRRSLGTMMLIAVLIALAIS